MQYRYRKWKYTNNTARSLKVDCAPYDSREFHNPRGFDGIAPISASAADCIDWVDSAKMMSDAPHDVELTAVGGSQEPDPRDEVDIAAETHALFQQYIAACKAMDIQPVDKLISQFQV